MKAPTRLEDLLRAIAAGDRRAFDDLYAACSAKLYGIALRILRRRDLAEDALQEAFLKIWRQAGDYAPERGSPIAWMATIQRNQALDHLRGLRVNANPSASEDEENPDASPDMVLPDPAQASADNELLRRLVRCLQRLEPEARQCILMAYYLGYTHEELARRLAAPVGTIKSWIRRGLMRVRDCLDER